MIVMKFGGTSVGSVESILNVRKIVESAQTPVIIVVSALGGITDKLIQTSRTASSGDASYVTMFDEIEHRHNDMIAQVIPDGAEKDKLYQEVDTLLNELKNIFQGIYLIRDLSNKPPIPSSAMASASLRSSSPPSFPKLYATTLVPSSRPNINTASISSTKSSPKSSSATSLPRSTTSASSRASSRQIRRRATSPIWDEAVPTIPLPSSPPHSTRNDWRYGPTSTDS
jgi:hypothetical protein